MVLGKSENIESCTSNAGYTSRYFSPGRGMWQGCCVAPYLFLIAVEVLAIWITGDEEVVISQFVDDMTVFVKSEASIRSLLRVIDSFGAASGLQIN